MRANQIFVNIINSFGGWLNQAKEIDRIQPDIADIILKLKDFGANFNFLIAIDVGPDLKNTSNNIIAVRIHQMVTSNSIDLICLFLFLFV